MSQLGLPAEGGDRLNLLEDHLAHRVTAVHVDRTDAHHLNKDIKRILKLIFHSNKNRLRLPNPKPALTLGILVSLLGF